MNEITRVAEESPATEVTVAGDREIAHAPQHQAHAASLLNIIARAATDPAVDVVKMQALLDMQERVLAKQAEADFNAAMVRLSADMPRVKKNGRVELGAGKGSYAFATWPDMDKIIRPLMQREGFTLSFDMATKEGGGGVVTGTLLHAGGHSRTASIPLALDVGAGRNNLQAMGSTLSYGKRYVAEMLLNIVRDDDDDGATGGKVYIANEQVVELVELCKATKTQEGRFLEVMTSGARSMEEVEAADYTRLKNALMEKRRLQQAKGTPK